MFDRLFGSIPTTWLSRLNTLLVRPTITLAWFVSKTNNSTVSDKHITRSPKRFSRLLCVSTKNSTVRINGLMVLPTVFLGCFLSIPTPRQSAQRIIPHLNDFVFCFVFIPTHQHCRINALCSKCFDWLIFVYTVNTTVTRLNSLLILSIV